MQKNRLAAIGAFNGDWSEFGAREGGVEMLSQQGNLDEGATVSIAVELTAGQRYVFEAKCDGDCTDLDLVLHDAADAEVVSDELLDALPLVEYTSGVGGGYRLDVRMVACSIEPCGYKVVGSAMGAAEPPDSVQ